MERVDSKALESQEEARIWLKEPLAKAGKEKGSARKECPKRGMEKPTGTRTRKAKVDTRDKAKVDTRGCATTVAKSGTK